VQASGNGHLCFGKHHRKIGSQKTALSVSTGSRPIRSLHRARPAATLGAIQVQTSVRWTRRVAGFYAHGETDTARTLRTKHGPLGCRGSQLLREHPTAIAFQKHTRRKRPPASALPRPAAERSVLCPKCPRCVRFSMSVETSHLWQLTVAAIKYSDAIHQLGQQDCLMSLRAAPLDLGAG